MNNRIVSAWFPEEEWASAIAVCTSGQFIGLAFLTPLPVYIQTMVSWRGLFGSLCRIVPQPRTVVTADRIKPPLGYN